MAKRNTEWSQSKYKRYLKEGRGQGEGVQYKPWLITQDFPSMGTATRAFSQKTKRMHHFFSNIQLMYFYLLDWEQSVIDIREHYPLHDLNNTLCNAEDLRLDKFIDKKNSIPYIITTTFLITYLQEGKAKYAVRSIKYASELEKKITQEKLEIERRYWKEKDADWGIVTNRDINMIKAKNIELLHSYIKLGNDNNNGIESITELSEGLYIRLMQENNSINNILKRFDSDYDLEQGSSLSIFKYLLANRRICVDLGKPISLKMSSKTIEFPCHDYKGVDNEIYS